MVASDQRIHIGMTSPSEEKRGSGGGGGEGFQQTMSSEYQCRRTALSTPSTLLPPPSHISVSITPLSPAFYHGTLTPVLFSPLPNLHMSFSQNSGCRLLIWVVPFPITVVPLPLQLQSLFVFLFVCLLPSFWCEAGRKVYFRH